MRGKRQLRGKCHRNVSLEKEVDPPTLRQRMNKSKNRRDFMQLSEEKLLECSIAENRNEQTQIDISTEWDCIKVTRNQTIPIMRNLCDSTKIDERTYFIHNSCAYDSLLHLLTSGIVLVKSYKNQLECVDNRMLKLGMSILEKLATNIIIKDLIF